MDILIPSCKHHDELKSMVSEIKRTTKDANIILSGANVSAATNRNYCLHIAKKETVIMIDDDITGFYCGWAESLIESVTDSVCVVSARLMTSSGAYGTMMDVEPPSWPHKKVEIVKCVPTAAIAFVNDGLMFDQNFIGSGFEDTDWMIRKLIKYPEKDIVVNNTVQLVHINEAKNQTGAYWKANEAYYRCKWNLKDENNIISKIYCERGLNGQSQKR